MLTQPCYCSRVRKICGMNFRVLAVIVLIVYGFFKEFRPVLPYFNEYLTNSGRNFTDEMLNHEVYPVWTYSYLAFLLPVLLLSDFTRHFIFVILGNCAQLGTMISMIFGTSIVAMKFMEIFYGFATACEVSYMSFVYSMVENDKSYQKITSWMRASILAGMFSSFAMGQNLWSTIGEESGVSVAYNGLTEAINALMGAVRLQAALLLVVSRTNSLLIAYILHVLFSFLYQTSATVSTFLIAREAPAKHHGLIFGANAFVSLCLQTILTLIVADSSGLALPVKPQQNIACALIVS
ncbi:reduced folate carrier [Trichuris suis]|nr:reduced folate carrier [Trichuris suis]